jgi:hypothetical protein
MELETILRVVIERTEEGHSLDVIPMKMGHEDVRTDRMTIKLAAECLPQYPHTGSTVEDIETVSNPHFHAGGIASVAHVLGLGSGR